MVMAQQLKMSGTASSVVLQPNALLLTLSEVPACCLPRVVVVGWLLMVRMGQV
jgi:hypothetical protein